jgi:hypothetical protein
MKHTPMSEHVHDWKNKWIQGLTLHPWCSIAVRFAQPSSQLRNLEVVVHNEPKLIENLWRVIK